MTSINLKATAPVRTAIFPVAGLGTRFLPATKATPKELLPVLDTPLIQFAIDEARDAGIERFVFVSHPTKGAIERHVRHDANLSRQLRHKGKNDIARFLERAALSDPMHDVVFTMQHDPLGLGHAVICAAPHVLPGAVAILLPDDLILGRGCIGEMIEAYATAGTGHMVATMEVAPNEVSSYGVLDPVRTEGQLIHASGMVEKPKAEDAPSRNAVVGRYVLDGSIFSDLHAIQPGAGGEYQLTDAIARGASRVGLSGFAFSGKRFDCGSKAGMLSATIHCAREMGGYEHILGADAQTQTPVVIAA